MEIRKIDTTAKFDQLTEAWRTLQVWQFGPLTDLDDSDEDDNIQVSVAQIDGQTVAYLIADDTDLWHIETREGHGGKGYARQLAETAQIDFAYEVCSDAGARFCESINIEFEDCR
jgi:hypothetical protein